MIFYRTRCVFSTQTTETTLRREGSRLLRHKSARAQTFWRVYFTIGGPAIKLGMCRLLVVLDPTIRVNVGFIQGPYNILGFITES